MKNLSLLTLFVVLSAGCQINLFYSLDNHSRNILYSGIKNEIKINSVNGRQLQVKINQGSIESKTNDKYLIQIDSLQKVTLTITQGKKKSEVTFDVIKVPDPRICFSYESYGVTSRYNVSDSLFSRLNGIIAYFEVSNDFNYDCIPRVLSYTITRIDRIGKSESWDLESRDLSAIPNSATKLAKKAVKGDIYIFSNIKVKIGCTGEVRTIENKVMMIE